MTQWFHMTCDEESDDLFRLADGRFQFTSHGRLAPLMVGYGYVLADRELARYFATRRLSGVEIVPATLYRRRTNEEFQSHAQLCISTVLDFQYFNELQARGEQLAVMGRRHLFTSRDLKEELERTEFGYLRFSEGLSEFGAAN